MKPIYYAFGSILLGVAFFTGIQIGAHSSEASILDGLVFMDATQPEEVDFSAFWKAWHLLEEKYIPATTTEAISDEDRVWGAIQGLARSYDDPYTVFLPPVESEMFEEEISGEFGGVGMEVGQRNGIITVIAPLKDSPAEAAGLQAGDRVIEIDGESTEGMTVDEGVRHIRGEIGTEVVLKILREDTSEILDVTIVRDTIKIPTSDAYLRSDGVFVIELYNFGATSPNEFRSGLREFVESGSDKLIIDLRGNPGGFLEAAVDVSSWFLPLGKTVVKERYGNSDDEKIHRSKGHNIYKDSWDIVLLIDEGSASASEIVAGALQEHGIATLIGEKSFGKGSVQELVHVTPDTSLKVTVARWLTPLDHSISENGLEPDIIVELTREDIEADKDPQLDKAVEFLLNGGVLPEESGEEG